MTFEVTILGCGAATPTSRHHPSAQLVNVHEKFFLVDCGEGTQMQLRKYKFRLQRIGHIFISHLHGDHYLGLMGLISSLHLLGRKAPLHVYGPAALKELLDLSWKVSDTWLMFPLEFHPVTDDGEHLIYEDRTLEIYSIPLKHRIPCCGYKFIEKQRPLKLRREAVEEYRLQPSEILELKKGRIVVRDGGLLIDPQTACIWPEPPRSYAYCSDTAYADTTVTSVQGASLLYHESTFLESEAKRAQDTFHSTASQAADIALRAGCKQLLLGHYSSRYPDDAMFLQEAAEVFPQCALAYEGLTIQVT